MKEYLLVDGYNIINAWTELKQIKDNNNIEDARQKLIDILSSYQGFKGNFIIIVFDGHMVQGNIENHILYSGLEVVFTKEGETADRYIERYTYSKKMDDLIIKVATSDRIEQNIVMANGALRMSARELYKEVMLGYNNMRVKFIDNVKPVPHKLGNRLHPLTVKKLEKWRRE
ncbi:MAG: NYN domain-containing protein [Clostridia bacterium]|nr:NYN domain-containing protein [Clostridia bacterium]